MDNVLNLVSLTKTEDGSFIPSRRRSGQVCVSCHDAFLCN